MVILIASYMYSTSPSFINIHMFIFVASDGDYRHPRENDARSLVPGFLCCRLHATGSNRLRHHRLSLPTTYHFTFAVSLLAVLLVGYRRLIFVAF